MGIEQLQEVNLKHIDTLTKIIERCYDIEHFDEDWRSFTYPDKPNNWRVRFLLETIMTNNIENFAPWDIYDLTNIFSDKVMKYLKEYMEMDNYFNDTTEFKIFLQKFFGKLMLLGNYIIKSELLADIKEKLVNNLLPGNIDIKQFRTEMESENYKIITIIGDKKSPICLIDTNKWQLFFVDVIKNKILHECWNTFEKGYAFGDKKNFIFDEKKKFDLHVVKNEIIAFDIQNSDATILDFFQYLKEKYTIQTDLSIVKSFAWLEDILQQKIAGINGNEFAIESLFFIMNFINFAENKKNIFVSDTTWKTIKLWSYTDYKTPSKIHNWYKDKEAVQIEVKDGNSYRVIVTNWEEFDSFNVE